MGNFVDDYPGPEPKWEIPHLIRSDLSLGEAFAMSAKLSPTIALPGNWVLWGDGTNLPYVWDITMASDTLIEFQFGAQGGANPNYTNIPFQPLGKAGSGSAGSQPQAQVAAPKVLSRPYGGGFCPAGGYIHLLNKTWVSCFYNQGIYLLTSTVAANVYVSIYWTEFQN